MSSLSELPEAILQQIAAYVRDLKVRPRRVMFTDCGGKPSYVYNKTSTMMVLSKTIELPNRSVACHLTNMKAMLGDREPETWDKHFVFNPTTRFHSVVTPNNCGEYIEVGKLINGTVYRCGSLSQLAKRFRTTTVLSFNCILDSGTEIEGPNENTSSSILMYIE